MQAIQTRFLGPTNHRDARVVAQCQAGRIVVAWDSSTGVEENHALAARALAIKLGWTRKYYGAMYGGGLPNETGYAFVFVNDNPSRNLIYCFAPDTRETDAA